MIVSCLTIPLGGWVRLHVLAIVGSDRVWRQRRGHTDEAGEGRLPWGGRVEGRYRERASALVLLCGMSVNWTVASFGEYRRHLLP